MSVTQIAPSYWQRHRVSVADQHRAALARLTKMRPPLAIYPGDRIETRRQYLKDYVGILQAWHTEFVALADLINEEARDHGLEVTPLGDVASLEAVYRDEILSPLNAAVDGEE